MKPKQAHGTSAQTIDTGQQIVTVQDGHVSKLVSLYTCREVAVMLRVHWYTVMSLARSGKLRGIKVCGKWRFTAEAIEAFLVK